MIGNHISKTINRYLFSTAAQSGNLFTWGTTTYGWGRPASTRYYDPQKVQLFNQNVTKVATGLYHALILTKQNSLYSVGLGDHGRLGNGTEQTQDIAKPIRYFEDKRITIQDFACGDRHNILLSKEGQIFTWGYGGSYKFKLLNNLFGLPNPLGSRERQNRSTPALVQGFGNTKFIAVAAGDEFTLALSQKHELYGWGNGRSGRLLALSGNINSPVHLQQISYFQHKKHTHIQKIKSVYGSTLILFDNGKLFTFGENNDGVMGIRQNPLVAVDDYAHTLTPVINEAYAGQKVVDFELSANSLVLLTDKNQVFYTGLGLEFKPRAFPKNINNVKKVFATYDSVGVITNDNKIYYINDKFIDESDLDIKTKVYQVEDPNLQGQVIDIGGSYNLKYAIVN